MARPFYTREQSIAAFWSKVRVKGPLDCWLWTGSTVGKGYGKLKWEGKYMLAHRVAFFLSGGMTSEEQPQVCHTCDTPLCCNPVHLFVGSNQENMDDCIAKGRFVRGSMTVQAKLNEQIVTAARQQFAEGVSARDLAKQYGVSHGAMWLAVTGRTWKHL